MPSQFTDKNNGRMSGHADRWSHKNRRPGSHEAGQGSKGSRNQGTGAAGLANQQASDAVDTTKMSKEEKMKYFNSLGLLKNPAPEAPAASPSEPAKQEAPKAVNPVKELSDRLGRVFAQKPQLMQGIVKALQELPKEGLKDAAKRVLDAMSASSSSDPQEVFSTVMQAVQGAPEAVEQEEEEVLEPSPQVAKDAENREWEKTHLMPKPKREWYQSDADFKAAINQANAIGLNREAYKIASTAMSDAERDWHEGYNPKGFESLNDMVNGYVEAYWDEIEDALSRTNESIDEMVHRMKIEGCTKRAINESILKRNTQK